MSQERAGKNGKEQWLWVGSRPHTLETVLPRTDKSFKALQENRSGGS